MKKQVHSNTTPEGTANQTTPERRSRCPLAACFADIEMQSDIPLLIQPNFNVQWVHYNLTAYTATLSCTPHKKELVIHSGAQLKIVLICVVDKRPLVTKKCG